MKTIILTPKDIVAAEALLRRMDALGPVVEIDAVDAISEDEWDAIVADAIVNSDEDDDL